jgi:hypothetical protein
MEPLSQLDLLASSKSDGAVSMKSRCRRAIRRSHIQLVLCVIVPILLMAAIACQKKSEAKLPAPAPAPAVTAFPFAERIGWFQGPCLAISNQQLAPGTSVTLVVMAEPQKVQQARSQEQTTDPKKCKALLQDRAAMNAKPGISFYALPPGSVDSLDMGIGIVEAPANPTVVNGLAQADLNRDGQTEVFSTCTTREGIKFAVWAGKPYQGEPRWSGYEYLGYDLEPTCPTASP